MINKIYQNSKSTIIKKLSSSRTSKELIEKLVNLDDSIIGLFIVSTTPVLKFYSEKNTNSKIKIDSDFIHYINTNVPEIIDKKNIFHLTESEKEECRKIFEETKSSHLIPCYMNNKVYSILCIKSQKNIKQTKLSSLKNIIDSFLIVHEKIKETEERIKISVKKETEETFRKELEQKNKLLEMQNKELEYSHSLLKKRTAELLKIDRINAITSVISGIAHEISTPLLSISLAAELLEKDINNPDIIPEIKKSTEIIKNHLQSLIEFSSIKKQKETFEINETLKSIIRLIRFSIPSDTVLSIKTSATPAIFKGCHSDINQALYGLISLAISEASEITKGKIEITTDITDSDIITIIENTGKISDLKTLDLMDIDENSNESSRNIEFAVCEEILKTNSCKISVRILKNHKIVAIKFPLYKKTS